MKLIVCSPVLAEGRNPEVFDAVEAAIGEVPGARVVHRSLCADGHRGVITIVATCDAVREAAFRAIRVATEHIDLADREGGRPSIGAVDGCGFVPIGETTMDEAAAAARAVGARVGEELGVPVFLHDAAAIRAERADLTALRRTALEDLAARVVEDDECAPDFGPHEVHPSAGVVCLGAHGPRISFHVNLDTSDLAVAERIAADVDAKDGGLAEVNAVGVALTDRGAVQVAMSLADFRTTSPGTAFEEVRRRAAAAGVEVLESQIFGVVPAAAVQQGLVDLTGLSGWGPEHVLETHLGPRSALDAATTFLDELASGAPTPGGGSAAALTGGTAAALVEMVVRLTIGKPKYESVEEEMRAVGTRAAELRAVLQDLVRRDADAFNSYIAALRLPKTTDEEKAARKTALGNAAVAATRAPLETMTACLEVMRLALVAAAKGNAQATSDGGVASVLARAAMRSADLNVRINLPSVKDLELRAELKQEATALLEAADALEVETMAATGLID